MTRQRTVRALLLRRGIRAEGVLGNTAAAAAPRPPSPATARYRPPSPRQVALRDEAPLQRRYASILSLIASDQERRSDLPLRHPLASPPRVPLLH